MSDFGTEEGSQYALRAPVWVPDDFLLVDAITAADSERRIRGSYFVPSWIPELSPCLVAEAIGQLAAWAAMAQMRFAKRPVAALAASVEIRGAVPGGTQLELLAQIESCEADAVAYSGAARVGGAPVLEIAGCVGALLPTEEFDDPHALRERFAALQRVPVVRPRAESGTPGLPRGRSEVSPCRRSTVSEEGGAAEAASTAAVGFEPRTEVIEHRPGARLRAMLRVPAAAGFFAHHFPRKPVFPATLLLETQMRLARGLLAPDGCARPLPLPMSVHDVKLRSFIAPGQELETVADVVSVTDDLVEILLAAGAHGRRVSTARWRLPRGEWR